MKNILLFSLFLFSSIILFGQKNDCKCFNGIGSSDNDKPSLTFSFQNGQRISVCGYERERINDNEVLISEFNVFNCVTGESYVEYGAIQKCKVSIENNSLKIIELKYLPAGKDWKWIQVPIGIERIQEKENNLFTSGQIPDYKKVKIEKNRIEKFYTELDIIKSAGKIKDPIIILGKLEILALNGEEKASSILIDFENYFNYTTDGEIAEKWKDAVATVKWVKQ